MLLPFLTLLCLLQFMNKKKLCFNNDTCVEYLRNKTCSPCLHSLVKIEANVGRIREQISENPRNSREFSDGEEISDVRDLENEQVIWLYGEDLKSLHCE